MRARIVLFGALMLVGGCRTHRMAMAPSSPLALRPDEQDMVAALAHYALGSFYEQADGVYAPDAIKEFESAAQYDPGRHRIQSKIAVGYLMRRQPSKAIAALEASCRDNPNQLAPLVDLAVTYQIAEQPDRALACLERAIALAPSESGLYATAAKIHISQKNDPAALKMLQRGLRATASSDLALLASTRGRQLIAQKALQSALPYFLLLRDDGTAPASPALLNLIGQLYLETQQPQRAADSFAAASRGNTPPPETFSRLGATQIVLGQYANAITTLEQGCARYPANTRLQYSLALAYSIAGRAEDAYQTARTIAEQRAPHTKLSRDFYLSYGAMADRAGRSLQAEQAFEACLEHYPDTSQALNYLAYIWADNNVNIDKAMDYITRALKLDPENAAYIDTVAWVLYRQNRYTEAAAQLNKALSLMPNEPVLLDHLGDVYDALDAPLKARHYWSESLMQNPDNQLVRWKLEASGADVSTLLRRAHRKQRQRDKKKQ